MTVYSFSENNSGGSWWLDRAQYDALLAAGWYWSGEEVEDYIQSISEDIPWRMRHDLKFEADSIEDAVRSWEEATGENFFAGGCPCCGPPFSMSGDGDNYEYYSGGYEEMSRPF